MTAARHGSATSYKNGCRCGDCRRANRERLRAYRAAKRGESTPVDLPMELGEGTVVDAVRRDLNALQLMRAERATDAAVALALARLLDDPSAGPQHPSAAARLVDIMARLRADAAPRFTAINVARLREAGRR